MSVRCRRCLLPDTVPGLQFDETGLCDICEKTPEPEELRQMSARVRSEMDAVIEAHRGAEPYEMPLEIGDAAVTWVLVTLDHVPAERTDLVLTLKRGATRYHLRCAVVRKPPGRLRVRVVAKDSGEVVPAMVRLQWKLDGRPRRHPTIYRILNTVFIIHHAKFQCCRCPQNLFGSCSVLHTG